MAAAAGRSVAENPGNSYNPLFIYGGVGLGKTHLLHAIGHEALRLRPYLKIMYVSSEKFTNDLINGIREQRMEEFRNRYRSMDILMIDDIQFIAGKDQTQEEFFHTFNTLVEANKQVVISSDRSPKSMLTLEDRLRSRFEGGLIADVSLPDYEMRLLILQAKAKYQQIHIPQEVMEFIAHKIPSNIRELEGALIRVVAFGFLNKMAISVDLAAQALNDSLLNSRKKLVTKERIIDAVANFYNVEMKDLLGKSRSADIVLPRQVAMYIIREQTDHSLVEIGQSLGGRDHTTIMHGLDKIEQALDSNIQLRQQINTITQIVYNGEGK
jgi:chromosomal replication initiator protein